jgi:hypothetical protein
MNQSKQKMMKSKLKYYAQFIGINLLAALIPVLAVILIYGIGNLKNACTNPYVISQEIYDCCLWATIVVMTGFSVGFWLLSWADRWRKAKLSALKIKREHEELGLRIEMKVEPIEERAGQKNMPASADSQWEDVSGLTVKEIYHLYHGRQVLITTGKAQGWFGCLAGYDNKGSILYVGFTRFCIGSYLLNDINTMRDTTPDVSYVEPQYKSYDCCIPSLIRIHK